VLRHIVLGAETPTAVDHERVHRELPALSDPVPEALICAGRHATA
jgi:hypothetical protein